MLKLFTSALLFLLYFFGISQENHISGRVIDADSRTSLPFVNILINEGNRGGTTDIDGKFSLATDEPIKSLSISYIGYAPQVYLVDPKVKNHIIKLKSVEYELPEFVVYPTENPAHRIIKNAIANRDKNDPEKLPAFAYTSYDKMIFTLELDSLPMMDTLELDSSDEMREFLDKHHLFMMESVSERKFRAPDHNQEKVIATKVSGMQDPIFVFLLSQWQPTTFYNDRLELMGKNFVNPISPGSTRKYFFLLQDTLYYGETDTVFIISFRPGLNSNFEGLKGRISINTNNWAIQNVIAEPAVERMGISFRIQQLYERIEENRWFPTQLNTEFITTATITDSSIYLGIGDMPDSIPESLTKIPFGIGKSYIRNINLDTTFKRREFGNVEVEVDPNAGYRNENFWLGYRVDSLTEKELNTYLYIDSLGKAENFDRIARNFESLMTGKIPWGYFDLDMHRFLRYNSYESFAPGIGIHTNERLSQVFNIGGFARYGFKDKKLKYGGDFTLNIYNNWDLAWKVKYMKDVMETSGVEFWDRDYRLNNIDNFRDFHVQRMEEVELLNTSIGFRTFKYMNVNLGLSKSMKSNTNDYYFSQDVKNEKDLSNHFEFTEVSIGLRYAYGEKFIQNMRKKISLGTKYPVLWFQYTRGIEGFLDGEFNYNRYDIKINKSFYTNYIGKTSIRILGGYVDANIPYTNLYNGNASFRQFTLYAPNSFGTMRMNEFLSNKYVALYFQHDFEKLLLQGKVFKPEFGIATHIAFGWLDFNDSHSGIDYKTMEKGYYESGLLINNLLNIQIYSLGIGAFYRYGPYTFKNGWNNVGAKLTLKFAF
ncbi:MAG: DUF5686 and carboxypeptidase regulatory-like domain-containing protein [Bacteroidales bacterium]|nr:DUF5686 and carboxypeptidase regulatory-like domain-containing protein [Bacteroidales bacterium]MCF8405584.1 DUF5686 and carboxypeptidase regulatory-like domain-containing protein [Bacteroidales bacterium]